jgi:hypothetical protein
VLDEEFHRASGAPFALVAVRYHEAPEEVLGFLWVVVEHEEAHRRLVRVDGPEPRLLAEVGLSNGDGVGGLVKTVADDPEGTPKVEYIGVDMGEVGYYPLMCL